MNYVMSDIHGCYNEFMELLKLINLSDDDKLYILGDVIDRGPEPIRCIQHIMEHKNIEFILGNHEDMMLKYYSSFGTKDFDACKCNWWKNGGAITDYQYNLLSDDKKSAIYDFMIKSRLFVMLNINNEDFLLVHAGIYPYNMDLISNLKRQDRDDFLWIRDNFLTNEITLPFKVVFGHTPVQNVYHSVIKYDELTKRLARYFSNKESKLLLESYDDNHCIFFNNKIGIDGACVHGRNLLCLRLEDMQEFSVNKK